MRIGIGEETWSAYGTTQTSNLRGARSALNRIVLQNYFAGSIAQH